MVIKELLLPAIIQSREGFVYSQHPIYMLENSINIPNNIICPRQLYETDLNALIEGKEGQCHHLIVNGDFISECSELKDWMLDWNLEDLLGKQYGLGPHTYKCSKDCPIVCCFGKPSLNVKGGGYLSFGRLHRNHIWVWIDIRTKKLLGYKPPTITYFQTHRLN